MAVNLSVLRPAWPQEVNHMELINAKILVIIVEAAIERDILHLLEDYGARGYSITRSITGKGSHGLRAGSLGMSTFGENIKIETIMASEDAAKAIMEKIVTKYLTHDYAGLLYLQDVQVMRIDKF
jgi:hypothetical protein